MKVTFLLALLPALAKAAAINNQIVARDANSNGIVLDDITETTPVDIDGLNPGDIVDIDGEANMKYVGRANEDNVQIFAAPNGDYLPLVLDIADETDCDDCDAALAEAPAPDAENIANGNSTVEARSNLSPAEKRTFLLGLLALKLDFIFGCGRYSGGGSHISYWDNCRSRLDKYRGGWYRNGRSCLSKRTYGWLDWFHWFPKDIGFRCGHHRGVFRRGQPFWDGCGFKSTIGIQKGYYAGDLYGRHAWRHVGQSNGRYSYLTLKKGGRRHGYGPRGRGDRGNKNTCNVCK